MDAETILWPLCGAFSNSLLHSRCPLDLHHFTAKGGDDVGWAQPHLSASRTPPAVHALTTPSLPQFPSASLLHTSRVYSRCLCTFTSGYTPLSCYTLSRSCLSPASEGGQLETNRLSKHV